MNWSCDGVIARLADIERVDTAPTAVASVTTILKRSTMIVVRTVYLKSNVCFVPKAQFPTARAKGDCQERLMHNVIISLLDRKTCSWPSIATGCSDSQHILADC